MTHTAQWRKKQRSGIRLDKMYRPRPDSRRNDRLGSIYKLSQGDLADSGHV